MSHYEYAVKFGTSLNIVEYPNDINEICHENIDLYIYV